MQFGTMKPLIGCLSPTLVTSVEGPSTTPVAHPPRKLFQPATARSITFFRREALARAPALGLLSCSSLCSKDARNQFVNCPNWAAIEGLGLSSQIYRQVSEIIGALSCSLH